MGVSKTKLKRQVGSTVSLNGYTQQQTYTFNPPAALEGWYWMPWYKHPCSPGFSAQLQLLTRFHTGEFLDVCHYWVDVLILKRSNQCSEQTFSNKDRSTCCIRLNYQMLQKHYGCGPDFWQNNRDATAEYSSPEPTKTQVWQQWYSSDIDAYFAKIWIQNANFGISYGNFHLRQRFKEQAMVPWSVFHSLLPLKSVDHNRIDSLHDITSPNSLSFTMIHWSRVRRRCKKISKKVFDSQKKTFFIYLLCRVTISWNAILQIFQNSCWRKTKPIISRLKPDVPGILLCYTGWSEKYLFFKFKYFNFSYFIPIMLKRVNENYHDFTL